MNDPILQYVMIFLNSWRKQKVWGWYQTFPVLLWDSLCLCDCQNQSPDSEETHIKTNYLSNPAQCIFLLENISDLFVSNRPPYRGDHAEVVAYLMAVSSVSIWSFILGSQSYISPETKMHADLGQKLTSELSSFCIHSFHSEQQCNEWTVMSELLILLIKDEFVPLGALTD